jgi:hypothetical protein
MGGNAVRAKALPVLKKCPNRHGLGPGSVALGCLALPEDGAGDGNRTHVTRAGSAEIARLHGLRAIRVRFLASPGATPGNTRQHAPSADCRRDPSAFRCRRASVPHERPTLSGGAWPLRVQQRSWRRTVPRGFGGMNRTRIRQQVPRATLRAIAGATRGDVRQHPSPQSATGSQEIPKLAQTCGRLGCPRLPGVALGWSGRWESNARDSCYVRGNGAVGRAACDWRVNFSVTRGKPGQRQATDAVPPP